MESAVILSNGVGYEIYGTQTLLAGLSLKRNQPVEFWIYTHVREDALQLMAFETREEKQLFLSLLKVNGIGPKSALNILSGASAFDIIQMIDREDAKALSKLPKLGKKTAEQIILTLKGKLVDVGPKTAKPTTAISPTAAPNNIRSALVNLGFKSVDVDKVMGQLPEGVDFESGVRQSLAALTGGL